ncbi:MAG: hypothetical protein ACE5Z5_11505 [Candidatus Bathyarchaeia archaeon]
MVTLRAMALSGEMGQGGVRIRRMTEVFRSAADILNRCGLEYMVTRGVVVPYYGRVRTTC